MSQAELGLKLGWDQSFVSRIESGSRALGYLEFRHLCEALGVDHAEVDKGYEP